MSTYLFGYPLNYSDTSTATTTNQDTPSLGNITINLNDIFANKFANMTGFENYTFPVGITPPLYYSIYNRTDANIKDYNIEYFDQYYVIPLIVCISLGILIAISKWFFFRPPKGFVKRELGSGCMEICWNLLMFIAELVLCALEVYFLVVNTLKARTRFLGTQYIIYRESNDTSYVVNEENFIYNKTSATQFFNDFPQIGYSSVQSFMSISLNSTFNLTDCPSMTDTEVSFTKDIYYFKDFYYVLLYVVIITKSLNAYWGWMGFRYEFVNKWTGIIISLCVNAFSASELGFSFFENETKCLQKVDYFEYIYYFMFVFLGAFICMALAIVLRICTNKEDDKKCLEATFKIGIVIFLIAGMAVFIILTILLIKSNDDFEKGSGIAGLAMLALGILMNFLSSDDEEEENKETGEKGALVELDDQSNKDSEKQDPEKNQYKEIEMVNREANDVYVYGTERP